MYKYRFMNISTSKNYTCFIQLNTIQLKNVNYSLNFLETIISTNLYRYRKRQMKF
jgi:hypothetical protein